MRTFSAEYLRDTRRGMWDGSREALEPLALPTRERVLDVGCGTGAFTRVLREETDADASVVAVDADSTLLAYAASDGPAVAGDATELPFADGAFDLVTCQALLVNLPDPATAIREFGRVSADLVAAVEPDNGAVGVSSTVRGERSLARRAREAYVSGVQTDVTLGADARGTFAAAGVDVVASTTYRHVRTTEPPYTDRDVEAARRKVRASRLADARGTLLSGDFSPDEYDALVSDWRSMGRAVVDQMADDAYRRVEVVPFHVTVGRP